MSQLDSAIAFAATAHANHRRKYDGLPYITHPIEVMKILWNAGVQDVDMLIAAVLHDVVEDTPVGLDSIRRRFGDRVAGLVDELTDKFPAGSGGNRRERKEKERARIAETSAEAQTIKYADFLSNTSSIINHDLDFARVYLDEKALILTVARRGSPTLLKAATAALVAAQLKLVQEAIR